MTVEPKKARIPRVDRLSEQLQTERAYVRELKANQREFVRELQVNQRLYVQAIRAENRATLRELRAKYRIAKLAATRSTRKAKAETARLRVLIRKLSIQYEKAIDVLQS